MPAMYTVRQFCAAHNIGTTLFYQEIINGRLVAQKIGRKTLISEEAAKRWREALPALKAA